MKLRRFFNKHTIFVILLSLVLTFAPAAAFARTSGTSALTSAPGSSGEQTTTTGAEEGESEEELERRKEVYTMVALITTGTIIVGIRNKRGRR